MAKLAFKHNGTWLKRMRLQMRLLLALLLSGKSSLRIALSPRLWFLALASLSLASCAGLPRLTATTDHDAQCNAWRAITYASPDHHPDNHDTPETIEQIRIHNQTGVNLGCWK